MIPSDTLLHKLQSWKTKLLDLSHGNRLLFYKPTKSSSTAITFPEPEDLFQQLVAKGKTFTFPLAEEYPTLFDAPAHTPPERAVGHGKASATQVRGGTHLPHRVAGAGRHGEKNSE